MNWDIVTQLGVGGTFCLLVLYVVFDFLKRRVNNSNNSTVSITKTNGCISRTEFDEHKKSIQYKDNCKQIQETIKTRFDGLEALTNQKFDAVNSNIEQVKSLIKNGNK